MHPPECSIIFQDISPIHAKDNLNREACRTGTHLDHRLSGGSVLRHHCSVQLTAEHRRVVVDICQVYVHCCDGAKRWCAAITSLHGQEVVPAGLIVQRLGH